MKSVSKLLFAMLLVGLALTVPTKVRASGSQWTCYWAQYGQCYDELQQWMGQCTYDCGTGGGGSGTCELVNYSDCYDDGDGYYTCYSSYYEDCNVTNTCIQQCINNYNAQYNSCLTNYCYQ